MAVRHRDAPAETPGVQARQVAGVAEDLPGPELRCPRDARAETEWDLDQGAGSAFHDDLETDLEPGRRELGSANDRPVERKEPAHRVADAGERPREQRGAGGNEPPADGETGGASTGYVTAGEDELRGPAPDRLDELWKPFRRVTPVGVHDDDDVASGFADPFEDRRREPVAHLPLDESVDTFGFVRADQVACPVRRRVVNDEDLGRVRCQDRGQPRPQRFQGGTFVEGGEDDGDLGPGRHDSGIVPLGGR